MEGEGEREGKLENRRSVMCHAHIPSLYQECNHYVLQIFTNMYVDIICSYIYIYMYIYEEDKR